MAHFLRPLAGLLMGVGLLTSSVAWAGEPSPGDSTKKPQASDLASYHLEDLPYPSRLDSLMMLQIFTADSAMEMVARGDSLPPDTGHVAAAAVSDSLYELRLANMNRRSPLRYTYNKTVRAFIELYGTKKRKEVARMLGLAHYYFPLFESVLDRYDMPLEIKYLAVVESALNPKARSWAGARGLWQFMYSTARINGLEVSSYIDERNDPLKATEAACQYLRKLYRLFDDWNLALAAYNSGPGNVSKAIRYSGGKKSYWAIRPWLPRETASYVPAFMAASYIFEYAEDHGLRPVELKPSFFRTDTVHIKKQVSFEQLAALLEVPRETLAFLNPAYRYEIIPGIPEDPHTLTLPKNAVGLFKLHEDSIYAIAEAHFQLDEKKEPRYVELGNRTYHRVRRGEVLGTIAERYGVRVSSLRRWNGLRGNTIRVGQRLKVFPRKLPPQKTSAPQSSTAGQSQASASQTQNMAQGEAVYHRVQYGESFYSIARKFPGISADNIMKWNNFSDARELKPGDRLKIYPDKA
ncbi:MAG: transglycosylase SLT domain-containing protein [Schleiferiaceae bacterium]|nr:transglycosylase SLT domain-containing protein [Schleiferiaceae bacterium]